MLVCDDMRQWRGTYVVCSLQSEFFHDQKARLSKAFSSPRVEEEDWVDASSSEEELSGRDHSPPSRPPSSLSYTEDFNTPSEWQTTPTEHVD